MSSWAETRQTWRLRFNKISGWPRTKQQSLYLSNNILLQTTCPHEQKLDWMVQAKTILIYASFISLRYRGWSCTKQPSWIFSNNFFQPIYSLKQKLIGMHHAAWRLRMNKIIPFRYQNLTDILIFFKQHLPTHILCQAETWWDASGTIETQNS